MTSQSRTQQIQESIDNNELYILKKYQKNGNNINYFFTPAIEIKLYKGIVVYRDQKNITLQFDKILNKSLYNMLLNIHEKLSSLLLSKFEINTDKKFYTMISETDTKFSIKCYLPQNYNKYFIKCSFENLECSFRLPHLKSDLNSVSIKIRNIWETNEKIGYNIEITDIDY